MKSLVSLCCVTEIAVTGVEAIKESFIHCYLNCGFQNRTKYTGNSIVLVLTISLTISITVHQSMCTLDHHTHR